MISHLHDLAGVAVPILEVAPYGKLICGDDNGPANLAQFAHHGPMPKCSQYEFVVNSDLSCGVNVRSGVVGASIA